MGRPTINDETKSRIVDLYSTGKATTATQIQNFLDEENKQRAKDDKDERLQVPATRTIQDIIAKAKKRRTAEMDVEDKPWSLLKMDKAGIPWDEAPMLLRIKKFLIEQQIEQVEPLTVGVAKWCYRIKKAACELTDGQVWHFAWDYARYERNAKLSNTEADSSYRDAELAIKPWASEENRQQFAEWEAFCLQKLYRNGQRKEVNHEGKQR